MSITSLNFLYFFLIVIAVYYFLPRRAQNYWLLVVSYVFVITWSWQFSLILLFLTISNFVVARYVVQPQQNRPFLLWLGIGINLAALLFFRTANFYLPGLLSLFANLGVQLSSPSIQILLPIGLAYYSLQNISYLVDVYRKQMAASTDFVDFSLYLAYFPKFLAGPIEPARTFLPKLIQPRRLDNEHLTRSITLIIVGLVRKLFIASILSAIIFWDAFDTPTKYTGPELISWLIIYSFYLYNDFAGYTNIARGLSGLLGIELPKNFNQPYFARNLTEFWNSWHITLSHWLRDYIYFPTGRALMRRLPSRQNLVNIVLPPMATMLFSGLWHGLGWNTFLWGGLHGGYLVIERIASAHGPVIPPQKRPKWRQVIAMVVVFILVLFAWAPFIMDLPVALAYWRGMLDWTYPIIRYRRILLFVPLFVVTICVDWLQRHYQDELFFLRWPRLVQAPLLAAAMILLALLMQSGPAAPFVYQGF